MAIPTKNTHRQKSINSGTPAYARNEALRESATSTRERTNRPVPLIDLRSCTGCGLCEQHCPTAAVQIRRGYAVIVKPEQCSYCEACERYCPQGAIGRPFTIRFGPPSHE